MATMQFFGPTHRELQDTFLQKASEGRQLLLVFQQACESSCHIEESIFTRAVDSVDDILPALREMENDYTTTRLYGIMDLSGNFEKEAGNQIAQLDTLLDSRTKKELSEYYAAVRLRHEQSAWRELPWYKRMWTLCPSAP